MKKNTKIFYKDACSYYSSALILINSKDREYDDQLLLTPIIFLLRHALELSLKAHILKYLEENTNTIDFENFCLFNVSGQKLKNKLYGEHSIKKLLDCMFFLDQQRIAPCFDCEYKKLLNRLLKNIIKMDDKSDYFRYPVGKFSSIHKRDFIKKYNTDKDMLAPEIKPNKRFYITEDNRFLISLKIGNVMRIQYDLIECINSLLRII